MQIADVGSHIINMSLLRLCDNFTFISCSKKHKHDNAHNSNFKMTVQKLLSQSPCLDTVCGVYILIIKKKHATYL